MANTTNAVEPVSPSLWRRIRSIHPGLVLAVLDLIGLGIASYLSSVELDNKPPVCTFGGFHVGNCETVASSPYSRPFAGVPVAVYGVILSITLFTLAITWWRTNNYKLLLGHYGLSLIGVAFEGWFLYAQIFLIKAECIWCLSYGVSLILRFFVALWVYLHTPNPDSVLAEEFTE